MEILPPVPVEGMGNVALQICYDMRYAYLCSACCKVLMAGFPKKLSFSDEWAPMSLLSPLPLP